MTKPGQFLGRNPLLGKALNKLGFVIAGLLYFANIHFSAVAIKSIAQSGGGGIVPPALADAGAMAAAGRYIVALSVSLIATIAMGVLLHPSGLASFVEEVRSIRGARAGKAMGALVVTVAALMVVVVGFALYTYDFYTTAAAFGLPLSAIFTLAAVPVWVNVLGPEVLFFGTNMYGQLIDGKGSMAPAMKPGTNSQARPVTAQMPETFNLKR